MTTTEPDVWTGAGVTVRCCTSVGPELVDDLWSVYLAAFGPLRTRAAARQVLWRDEFEQELTDERVWKYIALDATGRAVGLATLTADLATVPWISPEYYAARYPAEVARQVLFYVPFVCTDPRRARAGVYAVIFEAFISRVAAADGIVCYDVCTYNDESMAFARRMADWQRRAGARVVEQLDSQNYHAGIFAGGPR